jgi:hypothetical protein
MAAPALKTLGLNLRSIAAATDQLPSDTIRARTHKSVGVIGVL